MATPYQNFQSATKINAKREDLREARRLVLEKAKSNYEKAEKRREEARLAGEGTWMLASVSDRIDKEQKEMERVKKKKKENKKKKKHKKEKKKRGTSSSQSESQSEGEAQWVEKADESVPKDKPMAGPTLQRDTWMESPLVTDMIPTVTREELKKRKKEEAEKNKPLTANLLEQPGQHSRELNPYWKGGGTGLPEIKPSTSTSPAPLAAGDGGLSWLRKAYERCKQQAKDEGRSLKEVAAERYGSLEKLESMIREAERARGAPRGGQDSPSQRPPRDDSRPCRRSRSPHHRNWRDGDDFRDRRDRQREESRSERNDRGRDRNGDRRRRDTDSDDGEFSNRNSHDKRDSRSDGRRRDRPGFMRPNEDSEREASRSRRTFMKPGDDMNTMQLASSLSLTRRFAQPVDSDEEGDSKWVTEHSRRGDVREGRRDERAGVKGGGGWKKHEYKQQEVKQEKSRETTPSGGSQKRRKSSSPSSSSPSEDSSSSEGEEEEQASGRSDPPAACILSEDEMNALGAKILRAELMGDEDLASQLKAQLEQAQKAKEAGAASRPQGLKGNKVKDEEDTVVVLTRTGRDGMVRPLPEQEYDREKGGKKRRKMKNVDTHGKSGERARYFDDDDKHDLKTLVQMEKLGTAEDQNMMFARLAGRSAEQTNDDFQVDDVFLSKAARQQSAAKAEERERSKAVFEHRKITAAMDKCNLCFSKIPKHLIIAIGSKVYLCLPAHRSLTPGHCLIVPMQHVSGATALDEDVWQEIQMFRKALVRMFRDREQDLVVMETSMHLKHFPHMVIECVPLDQEVGDLAPIYFKKAIMEAGPEWASNKKVVDLSKKDVRHSVPKGFPYFSVDFGLQGGFAHVIEEEKSFPAYFGREIVGGMIDAEPALWRKPHREGFEDQRQKVLEFEQWWKPYDWTQQLNKD